MSFIEIDEAKAAAAKLAPSGKRGKKRKNATIARLNPTSSLAHSASNGSLPTLDEKGNGEASELRTGRWTTEETAYCDQLIEKFERGMLPLGDGIKLNDFLSNMLKSKQSRLTKKMKNARLSARCYKRTSGFIDDDLEARTFSEAESAFFDSIPCSLEKSEIKFHMQKEWRELYSNYCVAIGQKLDADSWLTSVEEMDRRSSEAKDAARMARRKVMMGYALSQDANNTDKGVFIEPHATINSSGNVGAVGASAQGAGTITDAAGKRRGKGISFSSSPFVGRIVDFLQRYNIPFEHVDAWVPSFVPNQPGAPAAETTDDQKCRLCYAGSATTGVVLPPDGGSAVPLSPEEHFDLVSFGEYSQKFSFDLGCGLPGRVYSSGVASWEQGIQKAPSTLFERCGGASQWSIQTVLGIPVPSPNVGRVVVLLYSRHDRIRDQETVNRIAAALSKLMPTPKWKLVVDVGAPDKTEPEPAATIGGQVDTRANDLLLLMRTYTPADKNSPLAVYLPGFTSLRLLLEKIRKSPREEELAQTLVESFSSYCQSGRTPSDVAWMVARDHMLLSQQQHQPQQHQQHHHQQHQQLQPQQPQQHAVHNTSYQPPSYPTVDHGLAGLQAIDTSSLMPAGLNPSMLPPPNQQMFASAPAPAMAQQQVPLGLQHLAQTYDFSQQLPGQPSA